MYAETNLLYLTALCIAPFTAALLQGHWFWTQLVLCAVRTENDTDYAVVYVLKCCIND
jgi:hypothetical protein